jgi:hypothetical protein
MVDTVRTRSALQTLLADNTSGAITAQTARDVLVSLFAYASPISGSIAQANAGTYTLDLTATEGYVINTISAQLSSGSCTLALQIAGTNVTGISAVSVGTTLTTATATAANTVTSGQKVTLVISTATAPGVLDFKITRTAS